MVINTQPMVYATMDDYEGNMTIQEFIDAYGMTLHTVRANSNPNLDDRMRGGGWEKSARHWRILISSAKTGKSMRIYFSQGPACTQDPTAADVLECLRSDSSVADDHYEGWRDSYGYSDSKGTKSLYRACVKIAADLATLLGPDGLELLRSVDC